MKIFAKSNFHSKSKRMQSGLIIIIIIGLVFSLTMCSEKPDYQEEYSERILWQLFLTPTPNPQLQCENAFQSKSTCLSQTSGQTLVTEANALANIYYVLFNQAVSNTTNLTDTCSNILTGRTFSRFTQAAADCFFSCKNNIWTNLNNNSSCSVPFPSLYSISLENNRAIDCIQSCQAITNTPSL